ncbi:hypothetical protein [Actinomadura hibisca]|uniref:hypothetical protein n=1 Tax=Actinomadura hibisca TaxID=68565 RepID=UPI00083617F6|nr:hypothetical protein [Actinomadura hibisca]
MPRAVTITGTRSTGHRDPAEYRDVFTEYVGPWALPGVRFYLGGASGIDTLAILWLAEATPVDVTVAVPARLVDQPADAQHAIALARESGRVEVVELGGEIKSTGFHARNRWMVDRSEFVIGFPLAGTADSTSGTHYTLRYGAEKDKPQLVVPV